MSESMAHAATAPELIHEWFPVGPLQCNCNVLGDPLSRHAIVVDPGGDVEYILSRLAHHQLQLKSIIHTHAHLDHILAAGALQRATGASLQLHPEDRYLWDMVEQQAQAFGLSCDPLPPPDHELQHEEPLSCCGGVVLHTPGHTPGSLSFWFAEDKLLLSGDTLFQRSIGRTDFPGGDAAQLEHSIRNRLYTLDESAKVIPGHGPPTSLAEEMRHNPFVCA